MKKIFILIACLLMFLVSGCGLTSKATYQSGSSSLSEDDSQPLVYVDYETLFHYSVVDEGDGVEGYLKTTRAHELDSETNIFIYADAEKTCCIKETMPAGDGQLYASLGADTPEIIYLSLIKNGALYKEIILPKQ